VRGAGQELDRVRLLYLAASKAGVVLVPLNYRCAPGEWHYVIADSGAEMVITGRENVADVDTLRTGLPLVRHWAALHELADGQPATPPERQIDEGAALYQLYTSGTTGAPKGAVLTHRAVTANMEQIAAGPHCGPTGERALVIAPMCHAGVVWAAFAPLVWGAGLVVEAEFDPARLVRVLDEQRIGYAALVPAVLHAVAAVPDVAGRYYRRRGRGDRGAGPAADVRLLTPAGGHGRGDARRLAAPRGRRPAGR